MSRCWRARERKRRRFSKKLTTRSKFWSNSWQKPGMISSPISRNASARFLQSSSGRWWMSIGKSWKRPSSSWFRTRWWSWARRPGWSWQWRCAPLKTAGIRWTLSSLSQRSPSSIPLPSKNHSKASKKWILTGTVERRYPFPSGNQ